MTAAGLVDVARRLRASGDAIAALVSDVDVEDARWKPSPAKWSILEIVGHLTEEERDDFRMRVDMTLNCPGEPWPAIDPEGAVREKRFNDRILADLVQEFLSERDRSLAWLRALKSPDWTRAYDHPTAGRLTASSLLFAWAAHDLLHVRQIAAVRYARLAERASPHGLDYAGPW